MRRNVRSLSIQQIAGNAADHAAQNVSQIRNIILNKHTAVYLLSDVDHSDQNESQRDLTVFKCSERGQDDAGKMKLLFLPFL